jgi:surface carbohydrate biosynthesis protein (TIGR04326 family)
LIKPYGSSNLLSRAEFIHIHYPFGPLSVFPEAQKEISRWNTRTHQTRHILLQEFTTSQLLGKTISDWLTMRTKSKFLRKRLAEEERFREKWAEIDNVWNDAYFGSRAVYFTYMLNLFESLLGRIPKQPLGIYLMEGQPWEFAFISAWRRFGHGKLIGVPHSTIRYWDLRYARDPRVYQLTGPYAMPRPDVVAVNGPAAKAQLLSDEYPEALRYLHLLEQSDSGSLRKPSLRAQVLLLGEYEFDSTTQLLDATLTAKSVGLRDMEIRIRPHPAAPKNPDFQKFGVEISAASSVGEDVRAADLVVAMSTTSAVLDAYCLGIPVIVIEDPNRLNGSPLLGREDVPFVRTPEELAAAMDAILADPPPRVFRGHEFFYLDKDLPRWRALLGLN